MTIEFHPGQGRARGTSTEIAAFIAALEEGPRSASRYLEKSGMPRGDEKILVAMSEAVAAPVLSVELTNAGPGGSESHQLASGVNGVLVRWSVAREDMAEVATATFPTLPGLMTRLVRFVPGRAPEEDPAPIAVDPDAVVGLGADDRSVRLGAWKNVAPLLGADHSAPWQLVRCRATWAATDGTEVEDLAAYIRSGEDYFVLAGDDAGLDVIPSTSVEAWESLIHVLPGQDEVKDPRA